jgi:hypothetical protein
MFLSPPSKEDGNKVRMKIVKAIVDHKAEIDKHPAKVKFLVESDDHLHDQIVTYNELLDHLERNEIDSEDVKENMTRFVSISSHQGPLSYKDNNYKGSRYNMLVEWDDEDVTWKSIVIIRADDPITVAKYVNESGLINNHGFNKYKKFINKQPVKTRKVNVTTTIYSKHTLKSKFGFLVPRNHEEAIWLDKQNNDTLWQDA